MLELNKKKRKLNFLKKAHCSQKWHSCSCLKIYYELVCLGPPVFSRILYISELLVNYVIHSHNRSTKFNIDPTSPSANRCNFFFSSDWRILIYFFLKADWLFQEEIKWNDAAKRVVKTHRVQKVAKKGCCVLRYWFRVDTIIKHIFTATIGYPNLANT